MTPTEPPKTQKIISFMLCAQNTDFVPTTSCEKKKNRPQQKTKEKKRKNLSGLWGLHRLDSSQAAVSSN